LSHITLNPDLMHKKTQLEFYKKELQLSELETSVSDTMAKVWRQFRKVVETVVNNSPDRAKALEKQLKDAITETLLKAAGFAEEHARGAVDSSIVRQIGARCTPGPWSMPTVFLAS
jgi:hypothetical protein